MSSLNRRGFTLIELLVGMVLLGIVSAAIYRVLVNNQRIYQAQTQRVDLQQNIRAATQVLPAELREMDAFDGDILAMGPDSIRLRAMRQFGIMCTVPVLNGGAVTAKTLVLRNELLFLRDLGFSHLDISEQAAATVASAFPNPAIERVTGIVGLVPDPHFEGGGLHQIERGGHLKVHADFNRHPRTGSTITS